MSSFHVVAIVAAIVSFVSGANAASAQTDLASTGHYAWRQVAQFGPRAPLPAPRRIWVPAGAKATMSCDSRMMRHATSSMNHKAG